MALPPLRRAAQPGGLRRLHPGRSVARASPVRYAVRCFLRFCVPPPIHALFHGDRICMVRRRDIERMHRESSNYLELHR